MAIGMGRAVLVMLMLATGTDVVAVQAQTGARRRTPPPARPKPAGEAQRAATPTSASVPCEKLTGEPREDCLMELMDRELADDVQLRLLRSMARDRREGTPLSKWVKETTARCGVEDCVGKVTYPFHIDTPVMKVLHPVCVQPVRLFRSACRGLLERATKHAGTRNLAMQAGHRLLTTFDPKQQGEAIALLNRYSDRMNAGPQVLRAELWLRAATLSQDAGLSFTKYRDLLAGTLREMRAPDSAVRQVESSKWPEQLWQSDSTRALKELADAEKANGSSLVVPAGSTAEQMLAARGMAVDLAVSMETSISTFESLFSEGLRWIFGMGGQMSRPNAGRDGEKADEELDLELLTGPIRYQLAGVTTRLFYEIMNVGYLRGMSKANILRSLEFQTALLTRYVVNRCGGDDVCTDGLFEVLRSSKGLLALAYGSSLPASRAMLLELTPEEEVQAGLAFRASLRRATSQGAFDSTAATEYQQFFVNVVGPRVKADSSRRKPNDRELLQKGEVLVDIMRATPLTPTETRGYVAFVAVGGERTRSFDLGTQASVDSLVEAWRRAASGNSSDSLKTATDALVQRVWRPIATAIPANAKRVYVAPDGRMLRVNWSLVAEAAGRTEGVAILPSWSHLAAMRRHKTPANDARALLATRPDFGAGTRFAPIRPVPRLDNAMSSAKLQVEALDGDRMTGTSLAEGLQRSRLAVLMSHGMTPLNTQDSLSTFLDRTFLALSGANQASDARMSATELARLDLRGTSLLVLAACRLGDGAILEGQGILGFPLALSAAGAPATVVSLWPAPNDESTELFLETFLEHVTARQESYDVALRAARAALQARSFTPRQWAGWTVTGDAFGKLP